MTETTPIYDALAVAQLRAELATDDAADRLGGAA